MSQAPAAGSIGPYRIVRTLGTGGWSTVYEVVDPSGARLALKRLSADLGPQALARFGREVDSLRRIDHPGVLRLLDAGVDGNAPYLVTPVVEGTSVRAILARGALGVEGALAIILAAADAVAAIHAAGLVHRDLKPENLMMTAAGDIIVIDLGLALGPEHSRHTAEDAVTGSVPYMSPEQIDDRAPSAASDVWALGVVLYEAIAGRRPFERARQSEEVAAILAGRFTPLDELAPTCTPDLSRVVASCLAASPALRPRDLAAALLPLIDWTPPASLSSLRALLLSDPAAFTAAVRTARVDQALRTADHALAANDVFSATRALERGLHYAPDDVALQSRVERLMQLPASRATVKGHPPPPLPAPAPDAGHAHPSPVAEAGRAHPSALSKPERSEGASKGGLGRLPRWVIGAGLALAIAATIGLIAARTTSGDRPAAAKPPPAGSESEPAGESIEPAPAPSDILDPATSRPAHVAPSKPAPGRRPLAP